MGVLQRLWFCVFLLLIPGLLFGAQLKQTLALGSALEHRLGAMAVDGSTVYLAGSTRAQNLGSDSARPSSDIFVSRFTLAANGSIEALQTRIVPLDQSDENVQALVVVQGIAYILGTSKPLTTDNTDLLLAKVDFDTPAVSTTTLGGSKVDMGLSLFHDAGVFYIGGYTESVDFPGGGGTRKAEAGYVLAYDWNSGELWHWIMDEAGDDRITAVAVDGNLVYAAGYSENLHSGALFGALAENNRYQSATLALSGAVMLRIIPPGTAPQLEYAAVIGGGGHDQAHALAVAGGFVWLAGQTSSTDFDGADGHLGAFWDGFVVKLDPAQASPVTRQRYLGGSGDDYIQTLWLQGGKIHLTGMSDSPQSLVAAFAGAVHPKPVNATQSAFTLSFTEQVNLDADTGDLISGAGRQDHTLAVISGNHLVTAVETESADLAQLPFTGIRPTGSANIHVQVSDVSVQGGGGLRVQASAPLDAEESKDFEWPVTIHNDAATDAAQVRVFFTMPADMIFRGSPDICTTTGNPALIFCEFSLAAGGNRALPLSLRTIKPGNFTLSYAAWSEHEDDNPADNQGEQAVTVAAKGLADLALSVNALPAIPQANEAVLITNTIINHGPDIARNFQLVADMGTGLQVPQQKLPTFCAWEQPNRIRCTVDALADQQSMFIKFETISNGDPIDYKAQINSTSDPTPGNNARAFGLKPSGAKSGGGSLDWLLFFCVGVLLCHRNGMAYSFHARRRQIPHDQEVGVS